jgi:hypothetical protein
LIPTDNLHPIGRRSLMDNRRLISYRAPEQKLSHEDQDGVIGFGFGLAALCLLLILILSVRDNWNPKWPPLVLVAGFVVAVLGLIAAVPAALQRERRKTLALCGIILNVSCLAAQLLLVVLYNIIGRAG